MRTSRWVSVVVLALVAGGCKKTVKTADVEAMVVAQLKNAGIGGSVECPDSVEAKAGAKFTCDALVDGETFTVNVSVTSVSGDRGELQADIADAIVRDVLVDAVGKAAAADLGQPPTVDCGAKKLLRVVGGKVTCAVDVGSHHGSLEVAVDANGTLGDYSIKFDEGPALVRTKAVEILTKSVGEKVKGATVDCGTEPVLFAKDGRLTCAVTADGQTGKLVVYTSGETIDRWEIAE